MYVDEPMMMPPPMMMSGATVNETMSDKNNDREQVLSDRSGARLSKQSQP